MSNDLAILKTLAKRSRFKTLRGAVKPGMLSSHSDVMLQWFGVYFDTYPEHETISVDDLQTLVRLRAAGAAPEALQTTLYQAGLLNNYVDESSIDGVVKTLVTLSLAGSAAALIMRYQQGEEVDLISELKTLATMANKEGGGKSLSEYIDTDINALLAETADDRGIKFRRLELLRTHVSGLQGGASVSVAAPVDKGKTSFIADTLTDWAPQCVEFFGSDRPILWLNNEGKGKRIIPRIYNAALGLDMTGLQAISNRSHKELHEAYQKAIGAPGDYIRVRDVHGANMSQIEQIIEAQRPCVVVFDMLANIRGGGGAGGNKAEEIEWKWQAIREMAVNLDFIAISTMQLSFEGLNMLHPPLSACKDSKIGAQGAMDLAIMLGALNDPLYQLLRGVSTPKNKFTMPGMPGYAVGQASFEPHICRFTDGG